MGSIKKNRMGNTDQTSHPVFSEAEEEALSNYVILAGIFEHLDTKILLEFSLVNKLWYSAARSVLRSQRRCVAAIKGINPCEELLQLNNMLLGKSDELLFTGMAIRIKEATHECRDPSGSNDDGENNGVDTPGPSVQPHSFKYSAIMERIVFRYLKIDWVTVVSCPAERLIETILREKREEIVEMIIVSLPESITPLKERLGLTVTGWLPNLLTLDCHSNENDLVDLILRPYHRPNRLKYELIQAAPQLQKYLGFNGLMDLKFYLDKGKVSIMKSYLVTHMKIFTADDVTLEDSPGYRARQIEMRNFLLSEPKLTKLTFEEGLLVSDDWDNEALNKKIQILRPLFQSVSSSLEETSLYQPLFLDLIPRAICLPLRVLKKLKLGVNTLIDQRIGFPTLERFNWGGLFPVLKIVGVFTSLLRPSSYPLNERVSTIEELRESLAGQPVSSSTTVEKVVFQRRMDLNALEYFRRLFPNVKEFSYNLRDGSPPVDQIFEYLWVTWPKLERITLTHVPEKEVKKNLDAKLCGEEASMEPGGVQTVQPSIMLLESLKILRIEISHENNCWGIRERDTSNFLITGTTNLLAFSRMPGFHMEVVRQCCAAGDRCDYRLEHLRPFVRLLDADRNV